MKDIDSFNSKYFPNGGGIAWPADVPAQVELARLIMGLGFVEAHDSWISRARDILNPSGPALMQAFDRELGVRGALANLREAERGAVEELVRIAVHGALFSALVSLDQFPRADLSISVSDDEGGIGPLALTPGDEDLHESFFEWLEKYSSESK
jgi:hypothetical protein